VIISCKRAGNKEFQKDQKGLFSSFYRATRGRIIQKEQLRTFHVKICWSCNGGSNSKVVQRHQRRGAIHFSIPNYLDFLPFLHFKFVHLIMDNEPIKVLIVEDDLLISESLRISLRILKSQSCPVVADNADTAIRALANKDL